MLSLLQEIEQHIYQFDKKDVNFSRMDVLLTIHAAITNSIYIPSLYVNNIQLNQEQSFDKFYKLLENENSVIYKHQLILSCLNISLSNINMLNIIEKQYINNLIEEELGNWFGEGFIYYEKLRYSPFFEQDVLTRLNFKIETINDQYLFNKLQLRANQKLKYNNQYINLYNQTKLPWQLDVFTSVILEKIEKQWQFNWRSHLNYVNLDHTFFPTNY